MSKINWASWRDKLNAVMQKDRFALNRRLRRLQNDYSDADFQDLQARMEQSIACKAQRQAACPQPTFDDDLPINQHRVHIAQLLEQHQVLVLCGETGSGKTTQLPKMCLTLGRGVRGMIGHTQPRRIAARSVAHRIAQELDVVASGLVACKMRFTDQSHAQTLIKIMTDGILLAETLSDRFFDQYDTLIIDEAHERSLNIDFLLGYIKKILPKRPDLKVIITSATIDPERFSKHFDDAPILEVSGRMFPVEVHYQSEDEAAENAPLTTAIRQSIEQIERMPRGDILVFLSGEREIRDTAEVLRKLQLSNTDILPLYARLNVAAQQKIIQPGKRRRIILATNVAETSITLPGIRYVVDPGYARISRYSVRNKVQRLPIEKISQASANQRKGRCGRVASGVCLRLYTAEDFALRPAFTDPEIQRTNLASVILQLLSLRLGDIRDFPFLEPPQGRHINDGFKLLQELNAIDAQNTITAIGRQLARLPIDPRLARMVVAANRFGALHEVLIIVSGLSIQDPRERPLELQQKADQQHEPFVDKQSDFLSYLKLWDFYHQQAHALGKNQLRKLCQKHFISYLRMREWLEVHRQIALLSHDLGLTRNEAPADPTAIHKSLLTGLLSHVANKQEKQQYLAARQRTVTLFPGSGLTGAAPKWIMSATLLETSKLYAHTNAKIDIDWIEPLAPHLLKHAYSEPHWREKTQRVAAFEQVSLMGLVLVARRQVDYGLIDVEVAHEIFVREALVGGKIHSREPCLAQFKQLVQDIEVLEDKSRRRDILLDEQALAALFDAQIPAQIHNTKAFHSWYREAKKKQPTLLFFDQEQLMSDRGEGTAHAQFPNQIQVGDGIRLQVTYRFAPGEASDGMNVRVPVAVLQQLQREWFEWLAPGLMQEKVVALLRGLPKSIRTAFVPAPNTAQDFLASCRIGQGVLTAQLAEMLTAMKRVKVTRALFDGIQLEHHLTMYFTVVDAQGAELDHGGDLSALQQSLAQHSADNVVAKTPHVLEQTGLLQWTQALPEKIECAQDGVTYWGYPALTAEGDSVGVAIFATSTSAQDSMLQALLQLTQTALQEQMRYLRKQLRNMRDLRLLYPTLPPHPNVAKSAKQDDDVAAHIINNVLRDALLTPLPATPEAFAQTLEAGRGVVVAAGLSRAALVQQVLQQYQALSQRLRSLSSLRVMEAAMDCRAQLAHLFYQGFVADTPQEWLQRMPVYLQAMDKRLQKAEQDPQKDRVSRNEFEPLWLRYAQTLQPGARVNPTYLTYRWSLEEFRVSLFSQPMKTLMPVSRKRLDTLWESLAGAY